MSRRMLAVIMLVTAPAALAAQGTPAAPDTTAKVTFGGFVDGYYAFDFNRPANLDRSFTTQPARHNEFNVNLAFVEAKLDGPRVRGRLAIQAGTSVQSNYAAEPRRGSVSGPDLARLVQEAVAGIKVADNLWVDGGIFLSHIGLESFISRDNPTYSRSLVADYTPYYESGAKATWQATPSVTVLVAVLNGWQNISETNADKSLGMRIDYVPSASTTLSWYNYVGNDAPDSARRQMRVFDGIGLKTSVTPVFTVQAELDYGTQGRGATPGTSSWYGGMVTGRYQLTSSTAITGRLERYADADQVLVATGTASGFRSNGASLGVDVVPQPRVLWRTELRGFHGDDAVFPRRSAGLSRSDGFVVSSLAVTF